MTNSLRQNYLPQIRRLLAIGGLTGLAALLTPASSAFATNAAPPTLGGAFAPDGSLWVLQQDAQARLTLQVSQDDGNSWQAPRVLDTGSDTVKLSGESPPRLLFGPGGVVLISYAQPLAKKFTAEIRLLRSTDGGATFAAPVTLHQDRQVISHSFSAMAFDGKGALHTVWIDSREKAAAVAAVAASSSSGKANNASANAAYRGVSLYRNVSLDGGATFGPDTKLADHSCECCRLALSATPDGRVAAMWRQVLEPNIRDHAFAILPAPADFSSSATPAIPVTPVRASHDNWAIDGCPHHGPGLAMAAGGGYHAVWFGDRAGVAQVRYGKLDQAGQPVGEVQPLPDERAEHADIMSSGSKLAIVWRSFDGKGMNLKAWISGDDGRHFSLKQLARTEGDSDYPRLLNKNGKIFVIWNTTGKRHVEAL